MTNLKTFVMYFQLGKIKKVRIKVLIRVLLFSSSLTFSLGKELDQLISRCVFGVLVVLL